MGYASVHRTALLAGLEPGSHGLCCPASDGNGIAQPLPRVALRGGANAICGASLMVRE